MKALGSVIVGIVAITISFGMTSNVIGQGQEQQNVTEQEQQNVTKLIMNQTGNVPQCSLAEQARSLGLDTSQFSNVTEYNACLRVIYESPDKDCTNWRSYHSGR